MRACLIGGTHQALETGTGRPISVHCALSCIEPHTPAAARIVRWLGLSMATPRWARRLVCCDWKCVAALPYVWATGARQESCGRPAQVVSGGLGRCTWRETAAAARTCGGMPIGAWHAADAMDFARRVPWCVSRRTARSVIRQVAERKTSGPAGHPRVGAVETPPDLQNQYGLQKDLACKYSGRPSLDQHTRDCCNVSGMRFRRAGLPVAVDGIGP